MAEGLGSRHSRGRGLVMTSDAPSARSLEVAFFSRFQFTCARCQCRALAGAREGKALVFLFFFLDLGPSFCYRDRKWNST